MKLDKEIIAEFETLLQNGITVIDICDILGISNKTFYNWKNRAEDLQDSIDDGNYGSSIRKVKLD